MVVWDDHEKKSKTEIAFNSNIKRILLREDLLVVVLEEKLFVFNFDTYKLIEQVETIKNPMGLCGISTALRPISKTICAPHPQKGSIRVLNYVVDKSIENVIQAHDSDIGALTVNPMGTLIASASTKGTVIRIFSAEGGEHLQELRRGSNKAVITELIFHPTLYLIACSSNKTSIHLFEIKKSVKKCIENKEYGFT